MAELITAIESYSGWLLALILALMIRELFVLTRALRDRTNSAFGLERESATARAIRAGVTVLLLATIGFGVNSVATVIAPSLPDALRRRTGDGVNVEPTLVAPVATSSPTASVVPTARVPEIVTAVPTEVGGGASEGSSGPSEPVAPASDSTGGEAP